MDLKVYNGDAFAFGSQKEEHQYSIEDKQACFWASELGAHVIWDTELLVFWFSYKHVSWFTLK